MKSTLKARENSRSEFARTSLYNRKLQARRPGFSTIFASAAGGSTSGSVFGVPGAIVGAVIGGYIGFAVSRSDAASRD